MKSGSWIIPLIFIGLLFFYLFRLGKLSILFPIKNMKLISPAFTDGGVIPEKFTCKGENISPTLSISDVPSASQSLVLVLEDPDAPFQTWDHWLLWNISPKTIVIIENSLPEGAISGTTSFGDQKYGGPCPATGTHRYVFRLYALDTTLTLPPEATKSDLEEVIKGHILEQAQFTGRFP